MVCVSVPSSGPPAMLVDKHHRPLFWQLATADSGNTAYQTNNLMSLSTVIIHTILYGLWKPDLKEKKQVSYNYIIVKMLLIYLKKPLFYKYIFL